MRASGLFARVVQQVLQRVVAHKEACVRVIIAGSRSISSQETVERVVKASGFKITEVICGGAPGVDRLGERYARMNKIPVRYFFALWNQYGRRAGIIRNCQMARAADALIAVWDGESPGTKHMLEEARTCGLRVYMEIAQGT